MLFDWTISLGTIMSALSGIGIVAFAWYRLVTNHLAHFKEEVNLRFDKVDADIRELRGFVFPSRQKH